MSGGVAHAAPRGRYDVEIVSESTPRTLRQLETAEVPLVIRNDGARTWSPGAFNVGYHWYSESGDVVRFDGSRTAIDRVVRPGDELRVVARLRAPREMGTFLLQWDVVEEDVTWISERDPTPAPKIRIDVTAGVFSHAFTVLDQEHPWLVFSGAGRNVRMRVRNDGTMTWIPGGTFSMCYHWSRSDEVEEANEGIRTPIPRVVKPGETVEIVARLDAPPELGRVGIQWDMVHENVCWFSQKDPTGEPWRRIVVLPNPVEGARGATFAAILLLALVGLVIARPAVPDWVVALASVADLVWLAVALMVKQGVVLAEAGNPPAEGSIFVVGASVALVVIVVALLPRRAGVWAVIAIDAVASFIILADVVYLRFFGDVISVAAIQAVPQTADVMESIRALFARRDLWLIADLIPGIAIVLLGRRLRERSGPKPARWLAALLVPFLLPAIPMLIRIADAKQGKFVQVFQNTFIVQEIGVLDYHAFDLWQQARWNLFKPELTDERRAEIERWFRGTAPRRAGVGPWFGIARGDNLVMLQVESMQGFVIGLRIGGREVTPNLNRWLRTEAMWFSHCADQTAQGRTSDGEFATQVSLLPLSEGAVAFRFGGNRYDAIAEALRERGYSTLSAVPFGGAFWNRTVTHREYGYDENLYEDAFAPGERVGWGLNDRDFLAQMTPRLAAKKQPFVAFLITLSNHHPFVGFPNDLKTLDVGRWEGTPFGNYLHTMHFFDAAFGDFLDGLREAGLLDHTVIAVWGDHPAGLGWNEDFAKAIGRHATEPEFQRIQEVPLFIRVPGAPDALVGEKPIRAGQVDATPTILALLGVDPARYPFLGRNLLGNPGDAPVVRRYGPWMTNELLYYGGGAGFEAGKCYDVRTLRRKPLDDCRGTDRRAREEMRISADVIEYDLALPLRDALK